MPADRTRAALLQQWDELVRSVDTLPDAVFYAPTRLKFLVGLAADNALSEAETAGEDWPVLDPDNLTPATVAAFPACRAVAGPAPVTYRAPLPHRV